MNALRLRNPGADAPLLACALGHAVVLAYWPSLPVVAVGLWWNANTVSHNFLHRPFFASRSTNRLFSVLLTLLLGLPQEVWRQKHLAHHAGQVVRMRWNGQLGLDASAAVAFWTALLVAAPHFLLAVYLPGFCIGQALCFVHGHYEHAGGTTTHRGGLYNWLFFNDGWHHEHHTQPGCDWRRLPAVAVDAPRRLSRWPAILRWLEAGWLDIAEHLVLRAPWLQRWLVACHGRAFEKLVQDNVEIDSVRRILIVGGGLFPRSALVASALWPLAEIEVLDGNSRNLARARRRLGSRVRYRRGWYDPVAYPGFDLVIVPLALRGERDRIYRSPPATFVIVHDWIWNLAASGAIVSPWLLKCLNLGEARGRSAPAIAAHPEVRA